MEEWRKVPGYRRLEVSNLGNVRTVWEHKIKPLKPMEMKTTVGSYLKVSVTDEVTGIQRQIGIHNLVAEVFVDKPKNVNEKIEPNHEDGDKHNNRSDNLTWMTRRENLKHAVDTGLRKISRDIPWMNKSKGVIVRDQSTGEEIRFSSAKAAADYTGLKPRRVQYNAFQRKSKVPINGFLLLSDE